MPPINPPDVPAQVKPVDWDDTMGIQDGRVFTSGYAPEDPAGGLIQPRTNIIQWALHAFKIKKMTGDPVDPTGNTYTDESNFRPWDPINPVDTLYNIPMGSPARQGHVDNVSSAAINAQRAAVNLRANMARILNDMWTKIMARIDALVTWAGDVYNVLLDHRVRIEALENSGSAGNLVYITTFVAAPWDQYGPITMNLSGDQTIGLRGVIAEVDLNLPPNGTSGAYVTVGTVQAFGLVAYNFAAQGFLAGDPLLITFTREGTVLGNIHYAKFKVWGYR